MNVVSIIIVVLGIGAALLYFLVDDAVEKLIDWLFRVLGLRSGTGPLVTEVTMESDRIVLTVTNQGRHNIMLAAVEGRDGTRKRIFPTPYLNGEDISNPSSDEMARKTFAKTTVPPGQSITVILHRPELDSLHCQTLAILDRDGRTWPVDDFHTKNSPTSSNKGAHHTPHGA